MILKNILKKVHNNAAWDYSMLKQKLYSILRKMFNCPTLEYNKCLTIYISLFQKFELIFEPPKLTCSFKI